MRTQQIASTLTHALQRALRNLNDPRVRGLVSITRVDVAPDLSDASVFVSVLPAEHAELTMHGLRAAAKHIRHEVAGAVRIRRVPRLHFRLDETLKQQAALERALADGDPGDEEKGDS